MRDEIADGKALEWSRRAMLLATAAGAGLSFMPSAIAQVSASPSQAPEGFLQASQMLTGDGGLDPVLAQRYWAAFAEAAPQWLGPLTHLSRLAIGAEPLASAAHANGLDEAVGALTAAWFTGSVGSGVKSRTVAYAHALMYQTVADGLPAPTYALGGPAWWTADPPPAGVSPPAPQGPPPTLSAGRSPATRP
jgi:hypothetical protein